MPIRHGSVGGGGAARNKVGVWEARHRPPCPDNTRYEGEAIMSIFNLIENVVEIVAAPISIAADVAEVVTKPIADIATSVAREVTEIKKDILE